MADEIRVTREEPDVPRAETARAGSGQAGVPDYDSPEEARADIEATRSRMSETIEEIEDVLTRKKERIQSRLDVLAPAKRNPLASMGIALGAGIAVGYLTGGSDRDDWRAEDAGLRDSGAHWEARAHRLLGIAREQEQELRELRRRAQREPWIDEEHWDSIAEKGKHAAEEAREGIDHAMDEGERLVKRLASFLNRSFQQIAERRG